jgi:glycosyltransferase involved in cell wall biosynthesis
MHLSSSSASTYRNGRSSPNVSVVIPALNEERNLPHVFAALPEGIDEVILVDGGSVDDTVAVARQLRPDVVVVQQTRTGKGNALACGFAACTGDIIVMIDADGSTDPAEIPLFVAKLMAGDDFVKGSRFDKGGHSHDITKLRKLGNDGLNLVVNVLFASRCSTCRIRPCRGAPTAPRSGATASRSRR